MVTREQLYRLVDELPEDELATAARILEGLQGHSEQDPMLKLLDEAPEDDEPLTPEDIAAIEEGKAAFRRGDYWTPQEAKRELLS